MLAVRPLELEKMACGAPLGMKRRNCVARLHMQVDRDRATASVAPGHVAAQPLRCVSPLSTMD